MGEEVLEVDTEAGESVMLLVVVVGGGGLEEELEVRMFSDKAGGGGWEVEALREGDAEEAPVEELEREIEEGLKRSLCLFNLRIMSERRSGLTSSITQ